MISSKMLCYFFWERCFIKFLFLKTYSKSSYFFITLNKGITVDFRSTCILWFLKWSPGRQRTIFHILQSGFIEYGPHTVHIVVHQFIISQRFLKTAKIIILMEDEGSEVRSWCWYCHLTRFLWDMHWYPHSGGIMNYDGMENCGVQCRSHLQVLFFALSSSLTE